MSRTREGNIKLFIHENYRVTLDGAGNYAAASCWVGVLDADGELTVSNIRASCINGEFNDPHLEAAAYEFIRANAVKVREEIQDWTTV